MQRTFVMIKPNGIERALVGKIVKRIEKTVKNLLISFLKFSNNSNNWQWKRGWRKT